MDFSANQKRAARAILAASGWVVPTRISALVSLVAHCKALPAVDSMAMQLDALDTAKTALETLAKRGADVSAPVDAIAATRQNILHNPPVLLSGLIDSALQGQPLVFSWDSSQAIHGFSKG